MPDGVYFGPEIVERDIGGEVVRELKYATAFIVGTAPVHEAHADPAVRADYINKPIIIRRREDVAAAFGPWRDGYTLVQALDAIFDHAGPSGIGTIVAVNVFDPDVHQDASGNPDPAAVTNLDIIGAFGADGTPSGLKWAYACFQLFGWFPKHLLAPGYSLDTGVRAELETIAPRIRAHFYLDAPHGVSLQDVIAARGTGGSFDFQTNLFEAVGCWPHVMVVNEDTTSAQAGQPVAQPFSPRLCGVWLNTVMTYGPHHSPSNRPILGIEEMAQKVVYIPGDASADTQLLRGAGIVTAEERWGKGAHTAGNRSMAYPTKTDMRNFLHVLYMQHILDEAVLFFLDEWKDRNANPANIEMIEDRINAYLGGKKAGDDPWIYDGRFWFDREKTTPETVADGHLFWKLEWAPVGIMERLTVERWINIDLIRDPLGLATAEEPQA